MVSKIMLTLFVLLGTLVELALLWDPKMFSNDLIRYIAGIFVVLDVIALLKILMEI